MSEVRFTVPGKPHAKQRARSGKGFTFTPKETVNAETFIRLTAAPYFSTPFAGPVALDVIAIFQPPPSWSGAKVRRALGGPHAQRPDLDNIQKSIADALNGIAYADDGQIAEFNCRKVWGEVAQTVVVVRSLVEPEGLL